MVIFLGKTCTGWVSLIYNTWDVLGMGPNSRHKCIYVSCISNTPIPLVMVILYKILNNFVHEIMPVCSESLENPISVIPTNNLW